MTRSYIQGRLLLGSGTYLGRESDPGAGQDRLA